jgi:3-oxoacyl-[acyl-carrier protein] reductase
MTDRLVQIGKNSTARKLIQTVGLPLPLPQDLRRAKGPMVAQPMADRTAVVGSSPGAGVAAALSVALSSSGAALIRCVSPEGAAAYDEAGEAWSRPVTEADLDTVAEDTVLGRPDALIFDATGITDPASLAHLHRFFQPWVRKLARCGRLVVIGRPGGTTPAAAAATAGLPGFIKSVAKEVGNKGSTANLVTVEEGAESWLTPTLRWLLSPRSAFLTGQTLALAGAPSNAPAVRSLDGKVVLVTGAARGIGKATVRRLAEEGATVVGLDRPADGDALAAVMREVGGLSLPVDVTAVDSPTRIADFLRAQGGAHAVIHNAGITRDKTLGKMDAGFWDLTVDVNLGAVVRITEALLAGETPALNDGGRLICLSSVAGIAGNFGQTNYAASKSALIGFVAKLAGVVADRNITVNAIAPGFIETRLTAAIPFMTREGARRLSALGQGGLPVDIAEAVTFLCTPGAGGLTGQVVRVCGGSFVGA